MRHVSSLCFNIFGATIHLQSGEFDVRNGCQPKEEMQYGGPIKEAVFDYADALRASFRFLHGSTSEFEHVFRHWHEARTYGPFEDQDPRSFTKDTGKVGPIYRKRFNPPSMR